jgi:hypothetical protein
MASRRASSSGNRASEAEGDVLGERKRKGDLDRRRAVLVVGGAAGVSKKGTAKSDIDWSRSCISSGTELDREGGRRGTEPPNEGERAEIEASGSGRGFGGEEEAGVKESSP